jgi:hypothetical protein
MFVGALFSRLSVDLWDTLGPILANLPDSLTTLQFKIHLCMKYLERTSTLPQKRAQPRAARKGTGDYSTRPRDSTDAPRSITRTYPPLVWSSTIEPLVSYRPGGHLNTIAYNSIKFELLSSYGSLQGHQPPTARDTTWEASLRDGTFRNVVETVFDCASRDDDDERRHTRITRELLLEMIPAFQNVIN